MKTTTKTLIVVFLSLRAVSLLLSPSQSDLDTWGAKHRPVEQHVEQVWVM